MKHVCFALCLLVGVGFVSPGASQNPTTVPPELVDELARAEAK